MSSLQDLRNSAAVVLALVIEEMFPKITLLCGGSTEQGFYYDFLAESSIDSHMLPLIEEKMRGVLKKDLAIETLSMMRENAMELFRHRKQHVKIQQIAASSEVVIPIVRIEKFFDFCDAPLVSSTEPLKAFKLLSVEPTSYFSPSAGNLQAFRISGVVDRNPQELKKMVKGLEILKKNGVTLVAKEMDLFSLQSDIGNIAWSWKPKGLFLKRQLVHLWEQGITLAGYQIVETPPFVKKNLCREPRDGDAHPPASLELTGRYQGEEYRLPNSLTPSHIALFRSSRCRPTQKFAECGLVSGEISDASLQGIVPPVSHADYAHSLCPVREVRGELISSLQFIDKIIKMFAFGTHWQIIGRGKRFAGTAAKWDQLQQSIVEALGVCGIEAEESTQETAHAGPKLQCCLTDSLGREWLLPSISIDIALPEKLGLRCEVNSATVDTPVVVTTRLFGSIEKFIALLIEHVHGELPLWLTPEQVRVIAIGPKQHEYAKQVETTLAASGFRVHVDVSEEQLGKRIHEAEVERVPYLVVLGDQEVRGKVLSIRARASGRGEMRSMTIDEFLHMLTQSSQGDCKAVMTKK